jgi:hypothetical protein
MIVRIRAMNFLTKVLPEVTTTFMLPKKLWEYSSKILSMDALVPIMEGNAIIENSRYNSASIAGVNHTGRKEILLYTKRGIYSTILYMFRATGIRHLAQCATRSENMRT